MCSRTNAGESGFPSSNVNTDDPEWEGHGRVDEAAQLLLPGSCLPMNSLASVFHGHLVIHYSLVSICYACGSGVNETNTVLA